MPSDFAGLKARESSYCDRSRHPLKCTDRVRPSVGRKSFPAAVISTGCVGIVESQLAVRVPEHPHVQNADDSLFAVRRVAGAGELEGGLRCGLTFVAETWVRDQTRGAVGDQWRSCRRIPRETIL